MKIELKFDTFIKNANLSGIADEIVSFNNKIVKLDNMENPKVLITINSIAKSLKRLDVLYLDKKSKASDQEKEDTLKKLIISHQALLKLQTSFFTSGNEIDKKIYDLLLDIAAVLSAIYPLFLVSELISKPEFNKY